MTLAQARKDFRLAWKAGLELKRTNHAAGAYMRAVLESEVDDEIGDDEFLNALSEVCDYLER
jgi:hypothetical protein